jgi:RHS repeat-associated protein
MFYNGDSGLYLTRYRTYDPVAGRWISRDPMGERSDPAANLYRYVNGNPISLIDPYGLWGLGLVGIAGAEVSGGRGTGFNASAGAGIFTGGSSGIQTGGYVSGGMLPPEGPPIPCTDQNPWVIGASASVGGGFFFTNASTSSDLAGPFNQYNLNTPKITLPFITIPGLSFSYGYAGDTWIATVAVTVGEGVSVSGYSTFTKRSW